MFRTFKYLIVKSEDKKIPSISTASSFAQWRKGTPLNIEKSVDMCYMPN